MRMLGPILMLCALAGCGQENPYGATGMPGYPGMSVGPGGVQMPGMSVGPGGVQMPGMFVGQGGVQMPGMSVGPGGVQMPGLAVGTAAPAAGAPASFGVPECDAYAARACGCANEMMRAPMCQAATMAFQGWAAVAAMARDTVVQGCNQAAQGLAASGC